MRNTHTIWKILRRLKPYLHYLVLSLLFAAAAVLSTLYAPILTGRAIDYVMGSGSVQFGKILPILVRFGGVVLITVLAQWCMGLCNNRITFRVVRDIRVEAFSKLQKLPLSYMDSHQNGETLSRIVTDVEQFSDGLLMGFTQLFTGLVTILGTLVFMLSINVKIALVVILITPVSLFVASFIARHTYHMFQAQSETRAELTSLVDEMVGNQKVVQALGYEANALNSFDHINQKLQKCSRKAIFFSSLTNPCTRFVNGLVYAGVGLTGAFTVITGGISVGQLSCFLTYANQYTKPFNEISGVITELQNAFACAKRVFDFIEEEPEPADALRAKDIKVAEGSVELRNVSFSYREEVPLLKHLNLLVTPGQRVAIVGPTGCGKTTLINLLMRFYDMKEGAIYMDGTDILEITRDSLRSQYGMVLQETWLHSGTIAENIAYGSPGADRKQIQRAAKEAYADGFIRRMEQGYETRITEEGGSLSQGQKQLLCIARVMLKLPPVLILDEATSSIDTRTEMKVQQAFQKMMKGRTSFIVAHRLSTIREADVILVMKDGNIIEQGTHETLLEAGGFYSELYNSQFAS